MIEEGLSGLSLANPSSTIHASTSAGPCGTLPGPCNNTQSHVRHLAVRRLSLVDLAGGRQPLENEDGTLVLACSEIYNHRELRSELLAKGHRFRTESDCEVIVHLYEEIGLDCLKRLNGMFALALLDVRAHRLVLARDPAGMKPLYLAERAGGIAFASEARALLETGIVSPASDWDGIDTYLAFGYAPRRGPASPEWSACRRALTSSPRTVDSAGDPSGTAGTRQRGRLETRPTTSSVVCARRCGDTSPRTSPSAPS